MMKSSLTILALIFSGSAQAGFYDGNNMHDNCKKAQYFVMGYVAGAFDSAETGQAAASSIYLSGIDPKTLNSPNDKFDQNYADQAGVLGTYCAPKGAVLQQTTDIFCQYLAATPAERQEPANILLARALSKAWPCSLPKKKR